jgi:hypothetical protein
VDDGRGGGSGSHGSSSRDEAAGGVGGHAGFWSCWSLGVVVKEATATTATNNKAMVSQCRRNITPRCTSAWGDMGNGGQTGHVYNEHSRFLSLIRPFRSSPAKPCPSGPVCPTSPFRRPYCVFPIPVKWDNGVDIFAEVGCQLD